MTTTGYRAHAEMEICVFRVTKFIAATYRVPIVPFTGRELPRSAVVDVTTVMMVMIA